MDITLHSVKIRELLNGYKDDNEDGIVGYGRKLNIRPKFQREFVYNEKQKIAVIDTIFKNYPLNVMYWVKNTDGTFELLDGQQRTLSICLFHAGEFFVIVNGVLKAFHSLTAEQKEQFLNYELQIYICENGSEQEKLDWFRIINIAGEKLTDQELLNAVYSGQWITEAKRKFSKTGCVAYKLGEKYLTGSPIRQDYLETTLKWISRNRIEEYMSVHQHDSNADIEWQYFQSVINWVKMLFTTYRKEMKGIDWGYLYNEHKDKTYSASDLEKRVLELMLDDDVTSKKGIYEYVLSGNENKLSIRNFTEKQKREAYERQSGICKKCGKPFDISEMEGDHITPCSEGGKTSSENCQMLCRTCNRQKGVK